MKLCDGEVGLRPFAPTDREELARLADNPGVAKYLNFLPSPYTLEEADSWIALTGTENPRCNFAIDWGGRLVGACGIIPGSGVFSGTGDIGYWLGEKHWGKGLATRAAVLLRDYALNELLFVRLQASVFAPNQASARVLEKAGFYREAVLRKYLRKDGQIHDAHLFVRLRNP